MAQKPNRILRTSREILNPLPVIHSPFRDYSKLLHLSGMILLASKHLRDRSRMRRSSIMLGIKNSSKKLMLSSSRLQQGQVQEAMKEKYSRTLSQFKATLRQSKATNNLSQVYSKLLHLSETISSVLKLSKARLKTRPNNTT